VSFLENPPFNFKVKIISIFLLPIRAQKRGETAHKFFQKIKKDGQTPSKPGKVNFVQINFS